MLDNNNKFSLYLSQNHTEKIKDISLILEIMNEKETMCLENMQIVCPPYQGFVIIPTWQAAKAPITA
jgi:hypothetical protein